MNITVDENILFAEKAFADFGDVQTVNGRLLHNKDLRNTDILLVRSTALVNEDLLKDTPVKFVGTATTGTDHIDKDYLDKKCITFSDAKGCNAYSVAEYVLTAAAGIFHEQGRVFKNTSAGIIGAGNIGSKVQRFFEALGIKVRLNDPPLFEKTGNPAYVDLNETLQTDIVTIHTPITTGGRHPTYKLIGTKELTRMKESAVLINAARGGIIDEDALLNISSEKQLNIVLDVWEDEPFIDPNIIRLADYASPHAAGYSLEGKLNGTRMLYDALCRFTGKKNNWRWQLPEVQDSIIEVSSDWNIEKILFEVTNRIYDITGDTGDIKMTADMNKEDRAGYFDKLRKNYDYKREFDNYSIKLVPGNSRKREILTLLRFSVI